MGHSRVSDAIEKSLRKAWPVLLQPHRPVTLLLRLHESEKIASSPRFVVIYNVELTIPLLYIFPLHSLCVPFSTLAILLVLLLNHELRIRLAKLALCR